MTLSTLDPRVLRTGEPSQIVDHLQHVLHTSDEHTITQDLIHLIKINSIRPSSFGPWLGISRSTKALHLALSQDVSALVRKLALQRLGVFLSAPKWEDTWDDLGGYSGFLELFGKFSVHEVKQLCLIIIYRAKGANLQSKRARFTELATALNPRLFGDASHHEQANEDHRQLSKLYTRLIAACTSEVVSAAVVDRWQEFSAYRKLLLKFHADTLQALALRYIFENFQAGQRWLEPLLFDVYGYPHTTPSRPGLSPSMGFSFQILERLSKEDAKASLPPHWFMSKLVKPLLRRSLKKKNVEDSFARQVMDLTLAYLKRHTEVAKTLNLNDDGLLYMCGVYWSRAPQTFETQFEAVLSLTARNCDGHKDNLFGKILSLLNGVTRRQRYSLLVKYCQAILNCGLDREADLKDEAISEKYWPRLSLYLTPVDALGLFTRILAGRVVDASIHTYSDANKSHVALLRHANRHLEAEELATKTFEKCKKAVALSAGREQRAERARAAIRYATASGSLKLLGEAHIWARRYVRDPLTLHEIYRSFTDEDVVLLSGVFKLDASIAEIQQQVRSANDIMRFVFDTACLALREPSFNRRDWNEFLDILHKVVSRRRKIASLTKRSFQASDEEVYNIIWKDTLAMLISLEEKCLAPGNEGLHLDYVGGIVGRTGTVYLENEEPSTFRFFDEFAKARDALWRTYRISVHPAVAVLPKPYPQGLPLQYLIAPYIISVPDLALCAPYIAARVHAAVYPDPAQALMPYPEDEETRDAIGVFVDDYEFALRMMIPNSLSQDVRNRRLDQAWSFATGPLSNGRFTREEAARYWSWERNSSREWDKTEPGNPFRELRSLMGLIPKEPDSPLVPDTKSSSEIDEWNPGSHYVQGRTKMKIENLVYIDLSKYSTKVSGHSIHSTIRTDLNLPECVIPGVEGYSIFSAFRNITAKSRTEVQEGQILCALLYIDSSLPKSQLLSTSFPSIPDEALIRYPAVYLDGDFLSSAHGKNALTETRVFEFLNAYLDNVPPLLLAKLTDHAYQALIRTSETDRKYTSLELTTLKLIKMLAQSDRPALASEIVVKVVLDRVHSSSWHRILLSRGFLRRLAASDAQSCLSIFADAIIRKMQDQAKDRATPTTGPIQDRSSEKETEKHQSYLKVTTVKLLAELLADTECVSESFAMSVLLRLLVEAHHRDVRGAVVSSLLNILRDTTPEKSEKIIATLESMVPTFGHLRERLPITDVEWAVAEGTLELPELDDLNSLETTSPILWSLLAFLGKNPAASSRFKSHALYLKRVILPILERLKDQMGKWTSIFLLKHGLDLVSQQRLNIPRLPREWEIQHELLRNAIAYLPLSFLEEVIEYRKFNIAPPQPITELNKRLRNHKILKKDPSVQVWLLRYGRGMEVERVGIAQTFNIYFLLQNDAQLTGEITVQALQQLYLKLYTTILWHDRDLTGSSHAMDQHQGLCNFTTGKKWAQTHQPVVEAIILYVESLRTRDWQRGPNRTPAVLPDTFSLRLGILQYAARYSSHDDREAHCAAFAARVAKIIDEIVGGVYHNKFAQLAKALDYVTDTDSWRVACHLGDISKTKLSWLTVQDHLRIELASKLLGRGRTLQTKDEKLTKRVRALRASWKASASEEVRRIGLKHEDL